MAELKTRPNRASVGKFLKSIANVQRRRDSLVVKEIMEEITGVKPQMWGPSIVGFGRSAIRYADGKENEWFQLGFSPRKQALTLYLRSGFPRHQSLMNKLGKHATGKSCLYIKKLDDIHLPTLRELIERSVAHAARSGAHGT